LRRLLIIPVLVFLGAVVFVSLPFNESGVSHGPPGPEPTSHCRAPILIGWSGPETATGPNGQKSFVASDSCGQPAQDRLILAGVVVVLTTALCVVAIVAYRRDPEDAFIS